MAETVGIETTVSKQEVAADVKEEEAEEEEEQEEEK